MAVEFVTKSECSCDQCKKMCKHSPCIGSPNDIVKLIEAGYAKNLTTAQVYDHLTQKLVPVLCIEGTPWYPQPGVLARKCTMQDENGMCKLHASGLKPTEGKLMICGKPIEFSFTIRHHVLKKWDSELGKAIIKAIS